MKRLLITTVTLLVFSVTPLVAQVATQIAIFKTTAAVDCNFTAGASSFVTFVVMHINTPGATASQFKLSAVNGFNGTWFADQPQFPVGVGNTSIGYAVGYGACKSGPIHVVNSVWTTPATAPPTCSGMRVVPDPIAASGKIEVVDCAEKKIFAPEFEASINGDVTCPCQVVATENTTWGQIKTLYHR